MLPALLLLGCPPIEPTVEEDLGRIEQTVDEVAQTVWPGNVLENGDRHVRLLNGFFAGDPSAYWFAGFASRIAADIFWFCREGDDACPLDSTGAIDRDRAVGNPVLSTIPGEMDYSPFWLIWRLVVPHDYEPNALKSVHGIEQAEAGGDLRVELVVFDHGGSVGPDAAIMHCLLALDGTELQGNGEPTVEDPGTSALDEPLQEGWHKQYQLTFFDFTETDGVFPPAEDSETRPLMPFADIFVFFRDCEGGSTYDVCNSTSAEAGAVSERGVELDLTADGDKADNNNIISGFPRTESESPDDRIYSPLWRVQRVLIDPAHDDDVVLIDSTVDQDESIAKAPSDVYELVELGWVGEPESLSEELAGNAIPGNDNTLFFNCPSQAAE